LGEKFCPSRAVMNTSIHCVVDSFSLIRCIPTPLPCFGKAPKRLPKSLAITSSISIIGYRRAGRNSLSPREALAIMDSYSHGRHKLMAAQSPRTTKLYDRRNDVVSLDEVEKVVF
jgi:hypothetical protein